MIKMSSSLKRLLPVLFVSLLLAQCSKDDADESSITISSISPETGAAGTTVTISGTGFGATPADNIVKFNGTEAMIQSASATEITASVPANATTGTVTVQVGTSTKTGPVFTVSAEQQATKTYYIKFRANGVLKIFEDSDPGYQSCSDCGCSYIPAFNDERYAGVDICQAPNDQVTAADIQGWNNKTVLFNTNNVFPFAGFGYKENFINYHSADAVDQTGSEVKITSVVSNGSFSGNPAYKVSGTFKCKVAKQDGSSVTSITDGEFVVRYTQNY
jgi:hypothetical protein